MTIELHQTDNNQRIFDSFVQHVLDRSGVPLVDQPIEVLLESIEHGEASVDTALNLVVAAHVVHLFLEVCTPIEEPEWTDALKALKPRVKNGLRLCRSLLAENRPDSVQTEGSLRSHNNEWHGWIAFEYGLEPWDELQGYQFSVSPVSEPYSFFSDVLLYIFKLGESSGKSETGSLVKHVSSSFGERLPSWHFFMARDALRALETHERLDWDVWCVAVDFCSEMLHRTEWLGVTYPDDEHGIDTSEIRLPPISAEYWAWEFGRVAAMSSMVDRSIFEDEYEADFFQDWGNGLTALSLLSGVKEDSDVLIRLCWIGALSTWRSAPEPVEWWHFGVSDDVYPSSLQPTDHLFWLMRLGAVDGALKLDLNGSDSPAPSSEPPRTDMLMLGSDIQLGRTMLKVIEDAEQERERRIENELAERLGKVWDKLPPDAQDHLRHAELHLKSRKPRDASLDYANAVETVLLEWLTPPADQREWPQSLGEWVSRLREMSSKNRQRGRQDSYLRQLFDPQYASKLAEALDIFREARLPRAHGLPRPPRAQKARETVLGREQSSGVFELILRFAKRWQG